MRGHKRRAAGLATAAKHSQPTALNDAMLDVVNRKGLRCCVECGATSTPQWREGPMGPKTLCNACGVRRQRLLRKQQAATAGNVPTAPVAAVQARRRIVGHASLQTTPLESDDNMPYGAVSGSEHSSDETEVDWATAGMSMHIIKQQQHPHQHHQQQHQGEQLSTTPQEVEESCNEDESAAYDLLFFAGVELVGGMLSSGGMHGDRFGCGSSEWRSAEEHGHNHNTRRHVQPVRRPDDFYYYSAEEEVLLGVEAVGAAEDGSCKRRKMGPPSISASLLLPQPAGRSTRGQHGVRPWGQRGSSLSSTEDVEENEFKPVKGSDSGMQHQQHSRQFQTELLLKQKLQTPPVDDDDDDDDDGNKSILQEQKPEDRLKLPSADVSCTLPFSNRNVQLPSDAASPPVKPAPSEVPAAEAAAAAVVAAANPFGLPSFGPLSLPVALPVLPLSVSLPIPLPLPLPMMSARDLEILMKVQLEFQRACLQLRHADVACEAVGAVVAERRQAAANAHEQAEAASQQLAVEARAMADRYRLRDVLAELHSMNIATAAAAAAVERPAAPATQYEIHPGGGGNGGAEAPH